MTEDDDGAPQTKFTAMSEMSKELLSKGVEVTKSSSKKAFEFSKKITQEGIEQAKDGLTTLSEKKNEYLTKRDANKLEQSISEFQDNTDSSTKPKILQRFKSNKKKVESSELDQIKEQMKQIEHEFPTVLSEKKNPILLQPKKPKPWANYIACLLLTTLSLITLAHTLLVVSSEQDLGLLSSLLEFILPSWLSNSTAYGGFGEWQMILGVLTTTLLIVCSILVLFNSNLPTKILAIHYGGILCFGQLLLIFYSDSTFESNVIFDSLRDLLKTFVVVGIARTPKEIHRAMKVESTPTIFDYTGILAKEGKKSNTSDELEAFIEEGLSMDFRAEVAKPKPPRARAKFEAYEKILLVVSFLLWPSTILMTMAYDNGLAVFTEYSSGVMQVGSMWALSLFTLLALVRFDRSARGNGWYAKEKETYVGMMDLYSKAQAKHYEYVELRAAAEAQEILEKYPQLDKSKSSASANA